MKDLTYKLSALKEKLEYLTLDKCDFNLLKSYLDLGVDIDKIIEITKNPCIGEYKGYKIALAVRSVLTHRDVAHINNSKGIIITQYETKDHFRYGYIK